MNGIIATALPIAKRIIVGTGLFVGAYLAMMGGYAIGVRQTERTIMPEIDMESLERIANSARVYDHMKTWVYYEIEYREYVNGIEAKRS